MAEVESIKNDATAKSIVIKTLIALALGILIIMHAQAGKSYPGRPPIFGASDNRCCLVGKRGGTYWCDRAGGRRWFDSFTDPTRPECLGAFCQPCGHVCAYGHHVRRGSERSGSGQSFDVLPAEICRNQRSNG
jgi:hypothetical protein